MHHYGSISEAVAERLLDCKRMTPLSSALARK